MVLLDAVNAQAFKDAVAQLRTDIHAHIHDDTFTVWTKFRPDTTWDDGTADELWVESISGTGKLFENGAGGPTDNEGGIFPESPYRFRTLDTATIAPGAYLVINGMRLFRVDAWKPEDTNDLIANAYLRELLGEALPS